MSDFNKIDAYLEKNMDQSLDELKRYVSQPSISAQNIGLKECSQLVKQMLEKRGFKAEGMSTDGAPVVFAERKGKGNMTLLIYNNYNVQQPEPWDLWECPQFEPGGRNGKL